MALGALVSYDDRAHFGRVALDVDPEVLRDQVAAQVGVLSEIADAEGGSVVCLKPHGALYHRVAADAVQAAAVLDGSGDLPVMGMPGSLLLALAEERGRDSRTEGFPDRGYTRDGRSLTPRDEPGALVTDAGEVASRAVVLAARVDSVCVHGDSPGAVATAHAVRRALEAAGLGLRSCWPSTG